MTSFLLHSAWAGRGEAPCLPIGAAPTAYLTFSLEVQNE